jgi:SAM-dependent methyltransferase
VLLTISTTCAPATDLATLLHKRLDQVETTAHSFGTATVFFPEATPTRCTAALLVEADSRRLAVPPTSATPTTVADYVTDRPYASPSLLSAAVREVFANALGWPTFGRGGPIRSAVPFEIGVPAVRRDTHPRTSWRRLRRLGWTIEQRPLPLDERRPEWGDSPCIQLTLAGTAPIFDTLDLLCRVLATLTDPAPPRSADGVARLLELGDQIEAPDDDRDTGPDPDTGIDASQWAPLRQQRHNAVVGVLDEVGAESVLDLGCGAGDLLTRLLALPKVTRIVGLDPSVRALECARARLGRRTAAQPAIGRVELIQGSLTYHDARLRGFDAAVLMEVIEHIDLQRLPALEQVVFGTARPRAVIVTTPDADYNVNYPRLHGLRNLDHRFEWTKAEFGAWCARVAATHGYAFERRHVGRTDAHGASPTQLAVFTRAR